MRIVDLAQYILEEVMGASTGIEEGEGGLGGREAPRCHEARRRRVRTRYGATSRLDWRSLQAAHGFYEPHLRGRVTSEGGLEDEAFVSFFEWFARERDHKTCPVNFLDLDDETYDTSVKLLPTPKLR